MYTGITQGLCQIQSVKRDGSSVAYTLKRSETLTAPIQLGASVSIDGVCQTVESCSKDALGFRAMESTCQRTTLGYLSINQWVSVERSAVFGSELGGHFVYGHVDGRAHVYHSERQEDGSLKWVLQHPPFMMPFLFERGNVTVNGSSLTVAAVDLCNCTSTCYLVERTLHTTHFAQYGIGHAVNIELDATARMVVETTQRWLDHNKNQIMTEKVLAHG